MNPQTQAESCQPFTIQSVDSMGHLSPVPLNVALSFTFNGSSTPPANSGFYADSSCTAVAGGPPSLMSGSTQSSSYYFRWVNSEPLILSATVLSGPGLVFEPTSLTVGPLALAAVIAYPTLGVTFAWPASYSGYGSPIMKGENFQVTLEARSPLGNLLEDFDETDASSTKLNLNDTYSGLVCGQISWNLGIGSVTCNYPMVTDNFFDVYDGAQYGGRGLILPWEIWGAETESHTARRTNEYQFISTFPEFQLYQ
jgi:hypothetical protein